MPKIVTWNMQRSKVNNDDLLKHDVDKVRTKFLQHLVDTYDIVCLQEAPQNLFSSGSSLSGAKIHTSLVADNQSGNNPCRNMIITKQAVVGVADGFDSGHKDATRHPVTVGMNLGHCELYYSSFHATSSKTNAKPNTIDYLSKHDIVNTKQDYIWIVGADFNFDFTKDSTSTIQQPSNSTQQSGGILDGFSVKTGGAGKASLNNVANYTPNIPNVWKSGFFASSSDNPKSGYNSKYQGELFGFIVEAERSTESTRPLHHPNEVTGLKLSDHCPVEGEICD